MTGTPWSGSGFQIGALNLDSFDPVTGVLWGTDADSFDGWGATAGTLSPVQKVRAHGAWAGDSFATARTMSLKGWAQAPTALAASYAIDELNAAVSLDPTLMTVTEAGRARSMLVRRSDDVLPKYKDPQKRTFDWSIQVTALDPRKFSPTLVASTFLPSTSGGLVVPYTVPYKIPAVTVSGQVSLFNPGNETGPVRLRIDGPVSGPQVTHIGSKLALTFASSLVLGVGEWLDIDMEKRTVLANGQASRNKFITSRGWSGFEPGPNTWAFTAAAFNAAAKLTVTATPADQ